MPSRLLQKPRISQVPQHNPYDKFTQDEFDAWIGGITGALKRALGQEDQVVSPPVTSSHYSEHLDSSDEEEVERLVEFLGNSSDAETEASFSYSTARRVSKGKARDPRDGPGFGRGDQNEPIVIGSDSGEEEESEDSEEDEAIEEWDSQSEEDDDEANVDWTEAESSVQARIRHEKQDIVEENEDEDDEEEEEEEEDEEEESGGDEQQGEDDEDGYDAPSPRQSSPLVLLVDSDEEVENHDFASQGRVLDGTESIMERFDEDDADPLSTSICVGPPRHRAKQQRHVSPTETKDIGVKTSEDIQPLVDDTSFPPHEFISSANEDIFVELPDRWVGPETYAEDYYSGGDVKESHNSAADVLGMEHDERQQALSQQRFAEQYNEVPQVQDVIRLDIDEVQPLSEDTSFPPKITEDNQFSFTSDQPIEILDPWVGPKTYAEDFYSGGDVRPLQNGSLDPHRLGVDDQSGIIASTPQHEVEPSEAQPSTNVDVGDLSNKGVYESPQLDYTVELPEPWDGLVSDEDEDHPAPVEIKFSPHMVENPSALCSDGDTQMIVGPKDDTAPVKSQDITTSSSHEATMLAQEHVDERVELVSDHIESFTTSHHDDPSGRIAFAQAKASNTLYDGTAMPGEPENSVHDKSQDVTPVLDWMNDSAFIHDMPASTVEDVKRFSLEASTIESFEVFDSNETAVDKIGESLAQSTNISALEAQLPTAKASTEKLVEAVDQISSEAQSEAGQENTPEALKVETQLPSASLGLRGAIEDANPVQHDREPDIRNVLTHETGTSDKVEVDADFVLREDFVAPEISEVEETDGKLDIGAGKMSLDPHPEPEVQRKTFIQCTIANQIEVLDGDPASFIDVASKELNLESSEPVIVAVGFDDPARTPPEPEHNVSRSATPTLIEGLHSPNGDTNASISVDTCELDSQMAPAFQDKSTSGDLMAHICPLNTPHSQSPDPTAISQRSLRITEAASHHAPDLSITPPASETFQTETIPKGPNRVDSPIGQGTISVDSGIDPVPSDEQQFPLPSVASAPFPYPALPWIGPYSMDVVMRKASQPFLFADPYPASLSTPDDTNRDYTVSFAQFFSRKISSSVHAVPEHDDSTKVELANDVKSKSNLAIPVATGLSSPSTFREFDKSLELNDPTVQSVANDDGDENTVQQSSPLSSPDVECADRSSTTRVRSPPLEDDLPSILIVKKVHTYDQTPAKAKGGRPRKRKRGSSVTMASPLPRTDSSKQHKNKAVPRLPAKPRVPNRKASWTENGKSKEGGVSPISQGSCDRQSVSSRSSSDASAARRMLESSSRGNSRASSIASTAPSDNLLSPTLGRGNSLRHQPLQPPPLPLPIPLLHRHHHTRPQQSRPVQRTSSSVRQHDPTESSTSKQNSSTLHRHSTYSSSPVTRSNCRYHKISIPLDDESDEESSGDEDVKLVYFLVPGCSLGNKELNRDEKIIDHGDAQPSDGLLMTSDLDAYAFNAPLLSVLRLLVGVDMLREGEIYYLPLPGSDWVPRKVRETSSKMHQDTADHGPSHVTPRRSSSMTTSMLIAPVASHGPASTTLRSLKPSSTISQTSSELTDVEDSPRLKRFRFSPAREEDNVSELKPEPSSRPRKLKVIAQDSEDRTNSHDEGNYSDDHTIGRAHSNKGKKHAVKRSRTSDVIRGTDDGQKLKKQKISVDLPTPSST